MTKEELWKAVAKREVPLLRREGDWVRAHEHDKRIGRGDDYAGDAWVNITNGDLRWVAVGHAPKQST